MINLEEVFYEIQLETEINLLKEDVLLMYNSYTFVHANIDHRIPQNGEFCKLDRKNSHVEWNMLKFRTLEYSGLPF